MTNEAWLDALADELRRRGMRTDAVAHIVAETAGHLRDSGEAANQTFGHPVTYAAAVAENAVPHRPANHGPVRLRASGITKRYGRRTVLDGVNLTVRAGEVAAVVGANGCGKSTFLRICGGLAGPDRGEVHIDGTLGYCPQQGGTYDFLRPDEHFILAGAGRDWSRERSREAGHHAATVLDWDATAPTLARDLSGGTRQKLNLILAGLGNPDVLLLDEPYQGFDHGAYLDFWQQVWHWRDRGSAVVVVTHMLSHLDMVDIVLDLTPPRSPVDTATLAGRQAR